MHNNDTKIVRSLIVSGDKLDADLVIPAGARSIVLFAHGSGSSRHSTRNQYVAEVLSDAGFATLLVDLLTQQEKEIDEKSRQLRFNIGLLAERLFAVTRWLVQEPETKDLKIGYFGSSTGAAAALVAATKLKDIVKTIVCRGGRPDLAESRSILEHITAPTLLIVGGNDDPVITLNRAALRQLSHVEAKELAIIPNAGHLFEEPGKMEEVAQVASEWFKCYLLKTGTKFENKYNPKRLGLSSIFKERPHLQIRFRDRMAAGEMLASTLKKYKKSDFGITVIGIPRGGVPVADAVARKLAADFDIIIPRKLMSPDNSEKSIGAIMPDDSVYLDNSIVDLLNLSNEYIEMEKMEQKKEIERRIALYRPEPKEYKIKDRIVILVDDGVATGATMIAAARWIRKHRPKNLIIAAPVASALALQKLREEADDIEIIRCHSDFKTVEDFYQDFSPVTDARVLQIVKERQ